jgi:hypothetical protein
MARDYIRQGGIGSRNHVHIHNEGVGGGLSGSAAAVMIGGAAAVAFAVVIAMALAAVVVMLATILTIGAVSIGVIWVGGRMYLQVQAQKAQIAAQAIERHPALEPAPRVIDAAPDYPQVYPQIRAG